MVISEQYFIALNREGEGGRGREGGRRASKMNILGDELYLQLIGSNEVAVLSSIYLAAWF